MKIGILADIHGNAAALRATICDLKRVGAERLVVLGDIIGYYYDAGIVLELIREWKFDAIRGNHERFLKEALTNEGEAERYRKKYGSALDVAMATLSKSDIDWLVSLPDRKSIRYDDLTFELCHGSPRDPDQYVYPDADTASLDGCRVDDRNLVLMGHTHYPFVSYRRGCILLNPGSVGQARDCGGSASWCWIDTQTQVICFMRTPFDTRSVIAAVRSKDPTIPYLAAVLEPRNSSSVIGGRLK